METDSLNTFSFEDNLESLASMEIAVDSLLKVGGLIPYEYISVTSRKLFAKFRRFIFDMV